MLELAVPEIEWTVKQNSKLRKENNFELIYVETLNKPHEIRLECVNKCVVITG
jgi:hypothetical protein